jgi:SAM-dependent methyltransferase
MDAHATHALRTYERLAPWYDALTADYDHETWLSKLEAWAVAHGLHGRRLLDVACGTGKSFLPLLRRGYEVTACDLSPACVQATRGKLRPGEARTAVADMTALPDAGSFDLVTCLDDALNYVVSPHDLVRAFAAVRRSLAPGGLYLFDLNTLATYRTTFAQRADDARGDLRFTWAGHASPSTSPGAEARATVEVRSEERVVARATHRQRHHAPATVAACLEAAGLRVESVLGQTTGCVLHREPDELTRTKTVVLARRADHRERRSR